MLRIDWEKIVPELQEVALRKHFLIGRKKRVDAGSGGVTKEETREKRHCRRSTEQVYSTALHTLKRG